MWNGGECSRDARGDGHGSYLVRILPWKSNSRSAACRSGRAVEVLAIRKFCVEERKVCVCVRVRVRAYLKRCALSWKRPKLL